MNKWYVDKYYPDTIICPIQVIKEDQYSLTFTGYVWYDYYEGDLFTIKLTTIRALKSLLHNTIKLEHLDEPIK